MPRINKGDPWEIKFRRDARSITPGLTVSGNGRGAIKSTQITWKRVEESSQDISGLKNSKSVHYACMKELPWQKKSAGRNLEIIKKSVKEIKENANLNFKEVINKNAIEYDLKFLESSTKAIIPNTYRGKTYTDNLESYDEFFIEEIPSSHEMNIKLSDKEYKTLQIIKKELNLKESEVIKKLISQFAKNSEIIKKDLDLKEATEIKKIFSKYAEDKSINDENLDINFLEDNSKMNNSNYPPTKFWYSLGYKDEELSKDGFIRNVSSILSLETLETIHKLLENNSEKLAKLNSVKNFLAFEKQKTEFKKQFQSELESTTKIFKEPLKNFSEDDLQTLIASMMDAFKKEQVKDKKTS